MKILYIGDSFQGSTSYQRYEALIRLGQAPKIIDLQSEFSENLGGQLRSRIHYQTGYRFLNRAVTQKLKSVGGAHIDLVWVDHGTLVPPQAIQHFKKLGKTVVLYMTDDPTGGRDGLRFGTLLKSLPHYDQIIVPRQPSKLDMMNLGCRNVHCIGFAYDEVYHNPAQLEETVVVTHDAVFIGTWMRNENRDEFLLELIDAGINLAIVGNRWQKSRYWSRLQDHWLGPAVYGKNYVRTILSAKIAIGLLSRGNRDEHTTRSVEIPFIGGLLCAERTPEHSQMFVENEEAVFWKDAAECIRVIKSLLVDEERRRSIAAAGQAKILASKRGNEDLCKQILDIVKAENNSGKDEFR